MWAQCPTPRDGCDGPSQKLSFMFLNCGITQQCPQACPQGFGQSTEFVGVASDHAAGDRAPPASHHALQDSAAGAREADARRALGRALYDPSAPPWAPMATQPVELGRLAPHEETLQAVGDYLVTQARPPEAVPHSREDNLDGDQWATALLVSPTRRSPFSQDRQVGPQAGSGRRNQSTAMQPRDSSRRSDPPPAALSCVRHFPCAGKR